MKALTLTQPYATAIAMGYKHIETRSWRTSYRGELAIHAAKGFPNWAKEFAGLEMTQGRLGTSPLPTSAVLCIVTLTDCIRTEDVDPDLPSVERSYGDFTSGRWAWTLENVRVLPEPIAAKGALGLWEWKK